MAPKLKPLSKVRSSTTVSVAQAKAELSSLIRRVESKSSAVTILRRGVPVAQLVPFPGSPKPKFAGSMAGTGRELGDIISPTGTEWTAGDESWAPGEQ